MEVRFHHRRHTGYMIHDAFAGSMDTTGVVDQNIQPSRSRCCRKTFLCRQTKQRGESGGVGAGTVATHDQRPRQHLRGSYTRQVR